MKTLMYFAITFFIAIGACKQKGSLKRSKRPDKLEQIEDRLRKQEDRAKRKDDKAKRDRELKLENEKQEVICQGKRRQYANWALAYYDLTGLKAPILNCPTDKQIADMEQQVEDVNAEIIASFKPRKRQATGVSAAE